MYKVFSSYDDVIKRKLKFKAFRCHGRNFTWGGGVSISSGQRNLMKTYHNDANTSGITKIALKNFLDFF